MGMTKAKKNLLHNYPVDQDANGNYVCSWCTNGTQTTRNKWIDHVHDKHPQQCQRILNEQRQKKRQQTEERLEAEEVINNAISKMDEDDDDDEDPTTTTTNIRSSQEDKQIENAKKIEQLCTQFLAKELNYQQYSLAVAYILNQDLPPPPPI